MKNKDLNRFMSKVQKTGSCWIWVGCTAKGYGAFRIGSMKLAHRLSYEHFKGPIPKGLCVCHSCDNPKCVNPDHLWVGTRFDNMRDASIKGRTKKGWYNGNYDGSYADASRKLSKEDVINILDTLSQQDRPSYKDIGSIYNVSRTTIWNIASGNSYKEISKTYPKYSDDAS